MTPIHKSLPPEARLPRQINWTYTKEWQIIDMRIDHLNRASNRPIFNQYTVERCHHTIAWPPASECIASETDLNGRSPTAQNAGTCAIHTTYIPMRQPHVQREKRQPKYGVHHHGELNPRATHKNASAAHHQLSS